MFTATAELEANFEDVDMIKGTIEDFVDDSGMDLVRGMWFSKKYAIDDQCVRRGIRAEKRTVRIGPVLGTASSTAEATSGPSSVAGLFNAAFGCNEMGGCVLDVGEGDDEVIPAEEGFVGVSGVFGAHHSGNFAQPTDDEADGG